MEYDSSRILKYKSFRTKRSADGTPIRLTSQSFAIQSRRSRFPLTDKDVCRLQNCMPIKYKDMVKTHLSDVLEISTPTLESLITTTPVQIPRRKSTVSFSWRKTHKPYKTGLQLSPDNLEPVLKLINYLSKDDVISTEGLFRKTGNISRQKQLKVKLETATITDKDMESMSPHDCANVLKNYLHSLQEPLLTQSLFGVYNKIASISKTTKEGTRSTQLNAMQLVLQLLPTDNTNLLKPLMTLLNRTAFITDNLMSAYSLGIIFAPHLFCDRHSSAENFHAILPKISDLVAIMIESGSQIFNTNRDLASSAANFWREMELPNQLYYKSIQDSTDSIETERTSPKVHVVDLCDNKHIEYPALPEPDTTTATPKPSRKRLTSDTSDGIPEKRPVPEMFFSQECDVLDIKPKLSRQTNSIIFHTRPHSLTSKPVARVKPIPQSPITQFFKNVPQKIQRVMSTPRSRAPMALFQSPVSNTQF